jgi:chromosome segregation ATPase
MSIFFAALSIAVYATRTNWRDEIVRTSAQVTGGQSVGWKERYNKKVEENSNLKTERDALEAQLTAEKTAKIQALSKAEAEIASLNKEFTAAQEELKTKTEALAGSNNALKTAQDNLRNLTEEVGKLRTEIAASQKETDEQIKKAIKLADDLAKASGDLDVATERNKQLTIDVGKARILLKNFGASIEDPADANHIPVTGIVSAVSRDKVELSIGTDDGVRIGQELDIYRGDKYVGRVRIIDAKPNNAVASNLNEFQQFPIQRGDNIGSSLRSNKGARKL